MCLIVDRRKREREREIGGIRASWSMKALEQEEKDERIKKEMRKERAPCGRDSSSSSRPTLIGTKKPGTLLKHPPITRSVCLFVSVRRERKREKNRDTKNVQKYIYF